MRDMSGHGSGTQAKSVRKPALLALSLAFALQLALAGTAGAQLGNEQAQRSFATFAERWMSQIRIQEARDRAKPKLSPLSENPAKMIASYRGYGDDFTIELRPTGKPTTPFVGILRYTEHLYSCDKALTADCNVSSSVPVTEIFRFQDGRWVY